MLPTSKKKSLTVSLTESFSSNRGQPDSARNTHARAMVRYEAMAAAIASVGGHGHRGARHRRANTGTSYSNRCHLQSKQRQQAGEETLLGGVPARSKSPVKAELGFKNRPESQTRPYAQRVKSITHQSFKQNNVLNVPKRANRTRNANLSMNENILTLIRD